MLVLHSFLNLEFPIRAQGGALRSEHEKWKLVWKQSEYFLAIGLTKDFLLTVKKC